MIRTAQEIGPEDFLHFAQLDEFAADWQALGYDSEHDLWALELMIMANPECGTVIPGTGGLRKVRFGREQAGIGNAKVCEFATPISKNIGPCCWW